MQLLGMSDKKKEKFATSKKIQDTLKLTKML